MSNRERYSPQGEPNPESREGISSFAIKGEYENNIPNSLVPFQGITNVEMSTGQLLGSITDIFGTAVIIGERRKMGIMCFNKIYLNRIINPSPVIYEFTRDISGLWTGIYSYERVPELQHLGLLASGKATLKEEPRMPDKPASRESFQQVYETTLGVLAGRRREMDLRFGRTEPKIDLDDLPY